MPQKNLKFKDTKTGEYIVIPWSKKEPPTEADILQFKTKRNAELSKGAPKVSLPQQIGAGLYDVLSLPKKAAELLVGAPEEIPPEKQEEFYSGKSPFKFFGANLPSGERITRKAKEVGLGLLAPENVALVGGAAAAAPVAPVVIPATAIAFALQSLYHTPEAVKNLAENPSFETGTDLATNLAVALGAGYGGLKGAKAGLKGKTIPPEVEPQVELIPRDKGGPVDSSAVGPRKQRATLNVEDVTTTIVDDIRKSTAIGPGQVLLPKKGEQPVRGEGFTVNAPKVMPPTEGILETSKVRGLTDISEQLEYGPREGSPLVSKPTGFSLRDNPSVLPTDAPVSAAIPPISQSSLAPTVQAPITIPTVKPIKLTPKVEIPSVTKPNLKGQDWLLEQETDALQIMGKGAKGDLKIAIDEVLKVRGIEARANISKPKFEQETAPIINQKALFEYNNEVDTIDFTRPEGLPSASRLQGVAMKGKLAGKTVDDVIQDFVGKGVPQQLADQSAFRAFRPGEAGFALWNPFTKGSRVTSKVNKDKPITHQDIRGDFNEIRILGRTLLEGEVVDAVKAGFYNNVASMGSALDAYANKGPAGKELTRLIRYQRTEGNLLQDYYDKTIHRAGVLPTRGKVADRLNLTDEEFGNPRIKDSKGNIITLIERGAGRSNEKHFAFRDESGNLVPKSGYTLVDPLEGNLLDSLFNNATPANNNIGAAANKIRPIVQELFQRAEKNKIDVSDILEEFSNIHDRSGLFNVVRHLSNRIARAETFGSPEGANAPVIKDLITQIKKEGGNEKWVKEYVNHILSGRPLSEFAAAEGAVYNAYSQIMAARYLPFYVISNSAAIGPIIHQGSLRRVLPSIITNFRLQNRLNQAPSGALSRYMTDEMAPESFIGRAYGIRESESLWRSVAADVGRGSAIDTLELLKKQKPDSFLFRTSYSWLKDKLLKNDEQMADLLRRGKLTEKEKNFAAGRFTETTQGLTDPLDLPYNWTRSPNPLLNYLFTYKRFAFAQSSNLFRELKRNPLRGAAMLGVYLGIGEVLGDTKSALRGALASIFTDEEAPDAMIREIEQRGAWINKSLLKRWKRAEEFPLVARSIDNLLQGWALGLVGDGLAAMVEGGGAIAQFMAGAGSNFLGELSKSVMDIGGEIFGDDEIDWDKIENALLKLTPIGSAAKRSKEESE